MNSLIQALMQREGMPENEVIEWVKESVEGMPLESYEDILYEDFGLEPDYIFDLIDLAQYF